MPTSSALGVEVKTLYNTFNTQCKIETKSEHKKKQKNDHDGVLLETKYT